MGRKQARFLFVFFLWLVLVGGYGDGLDCLLLPLLPFAVDLPSPPFSFMHWLVGSLVLGCCFPLPFLFIDRYTWHIVVVIVVVGWGFLSTCLLNTRY
jgi:hypothetical protein